LTFVLYAITTVLIIEESNYWWIIGIVGVILSHF
jgi:presenilin-like A22 family membrane protease